ncbi:MAG: maltose acetyltransferase domain-containing protein [Anaerotignum sp.]
MDILKIMGLPEGYCTRHTDMPNHLQTKAKTLCWEYNQTAPTETAKRAEILQQLFGTCHPLTFIEPSFRCDYGFHIHTHGLTFINYNCVILDTSPVHMAPTLSLAPVFALPAQDMPWMLPSEGKASALCPHHIGR